MKNLVAEADSIYSRHLRKGADDPYHAILPKFYEHSNAIQEA